jgi:hypothetical protein
MASGTASFKSAKRGGLLRISVALVTLFLLLPCLLFGAASPNQIINLTLNEIVSAGITPVGGFTLTVGGPAVAGGIPSGDSNISKFLRYSTLNAYNAYRSITAIMSVAAPAGTTLAVEGVLTTGGYGSSAGLVTLNNTSNTPVVTGIGSGATGTGNDGINLQFELSVTNTALLVVGNTSITVTFTLTDGV